MPAFTYDLESALNKIDETDESLRSLVSKGLDTHGCGSELKEIDLFYIIDKQIPRDTSCGKLKHTRILSTVLSTSSTLIFFLEIPTFAKSINHKRVSGS